MHYKVNDAGMDGIEVELRRRTQEVRSLLNDLERSSRGLLASWEGSAQSAYYAAKAEWDSAANSMAMLLDGRSVSLAKIKQNYRDQDRAASSMFGGTGPR